MQPQSAPAAVEAKPAAEDGTAEAAEAAAASAEETPAEPEPEKIYKTEDRLLLVKETVNGHRLPYSSAAITGRIFDEVIEYHYDEFGQLTLTLDKGVHLVVGKRLAELHAYLVVLGEHIHHLLHALLNHFKHGLAGVHLRFLLQIADAVAWSPYDLAARGFFYSGYNLEDGGLAGPVKADDADFSTVKETQVNVFKDCFVVVRENLAHPVHREYNLFVGHG